jgi:hypothetical protein
VLYLTLEFPRYFKKIKKVKKQAAVSRPGCIIILLLAVRELSGGTISANSRGEVLAVPAIRASIGVDPGEYHHAPVSLLSRSISLYEPLDEKLHGMQRE